MKRPLISISCGVIVSLWIMAMAWASGKDLHRGEFLANTVLLVPLLGVMVALLIFTCPFWEDSSK